MPVTFPNFLHYPFHLVLFWSGYVLEVLSMQCKRCPTLGFIDMVNKALYAGLSKIAKKAKSLYHHNVLV